MMTNRRGLITGLASFIAAPAIIPYSSLMPVRSIKPEWAYSFPSTMIDGDMPRISMIALDGEIIYLDEFDGPLTGFCYMGPRISEKPLSAKIGSMNAPIWDTGSGIINL